MAGSASCRVDADAGASAVVGGAVFVEADAEVVGALFDEASCVVVAVPGRASASAAGAFDIPSVKQDFTTRPWLLMTWRVS